jgi:hypothetical protein
MVLAIATGQLSAMMPYIIHKSVPAVKKLYISKEIPDVSFVWMVLTAWGIKDTVVPKAARYPIIETMFISFIFYADYQDTSIKVSRLLYH